MQTDAGSVEVRQKGAQTLLRAAVEAFERGLLLCDAKGRVVQWNGRLEQLLPGLAALLEQGALLESVLATAARRGLVGAGGRADVWAAGRCSDLNAGRPVSLRTAAGTRLRAQGRRVASGGLVVTVAEIEPSAGDLATGAADPLPLIYPVLECSGEPALVLGAAGDLLHANAEAERLLGEALAGGWAGCRRLYARESRRRLLREALPALARGQMWEGLLVLRPPGSAPLRAPHRMGAVPGADGLPSAYYVFIDRNARRGWMEEELRRARDAAEHANRAKTRFLAAASHDLRQPLQAVSMFVEVLAAGVAEPKQARLVGRIKDSVQALENLLNALLDVSKLEAGLVEANVQPTPLKPLVERLAAEFGPLAAAEKLHLRYRSCPVVVRTDPVLLERILRNLLKNALRYTREGGIILACRRRRDHVRVEVRDTGIGIPSGHLKLIFQEFHQIGNDERDRRQGLGLGLAIVDRLARLLEHPIDVASKPGQGSCFGVSVPLAAQSDARPAPKQLVFDMPRGDALVALIDDEPDVLDSARMLIESWGYGVVTALDVDEALRCLRNGRQPDVILADYRLRNGCTGGQVIERIRGWARRDIPAIIITGDTAPERLRQATARGYRLLHKPVQPGSLRSAIEGALAQR